MRFMMLMIPKVYQKPVDPNFLPPADMVGKMMKYNSDLAKAGVLLSLDGLRPPQAGARITFPGGRGKITDGPFSEAKEVLGGYWVIQVKSKEEAVEWAKRCPALEGDTVEVRQIQEMADFPSEIQSLVPDELKTLGR